MASGLLNEWCKLGDQPTSKLSAASTARPEMVALLFCRDRRAGWVTGGRRRTRSVYFSKTFFTSPTFSSTFPASFCPAPRASRSSLPVTWPTFLSPSRRPGLSCLPFYPSCLSPYHQFVPDRPRRRKEGVFKVRIDDGIASVEASESDGARITAQFARDRGPPPIPNCASPAFRPGLRPRLITPSPRLGSANRGPRRVPPATRSFLRTLR